VRHIIRLHQVEKALDGTTLPAFIAANYGNPQGPAPAGWQYHYRLIVHGD